MRRKIEVVVVLLVIALLIQSIPVDFAVGKQEKLVSSKYEIERSISYDGKVMLVNSYKSEGIQPFTLLNNRNIMYGFINLYTGNIIDPVFECIEYKMDNFFSEGLEPVLKNGKWGYIDVNSNTLIPFIYDSAFSFEGEYARVSKGRKYGLINKRNDVILPFMYEDIYMYDHDVFLIKHHEKYGFYNVETNKMVKPRYSDYPEIYNNNLFVCKVSDSKYDLLDSEWKVLKSYNGRPGVVGKRDFSGVNKIIDPMYLVYTVGEGVNKGKVGVDIYQDGKIKTHMNPIYEYVNFEENGFFYSLISESKTNRVENGFISSDGKKKIIKYPLAIDNYGKLVNGLKTHRTSEGIGYVDENNRVIIAQNYEDARPFFNNGYAVVIDKNRVSKLIDRNGDTVIEAERSIINPFVDYDDCKDIYQIDFRFIIVDNRDRNRIYDLKKKKYILGDYEECKIIDDKFLVYKDGKSGLMDFECNLVFPLTKDFDYNEYKDGYIRHRTKAGEYLTDLKNKKLHNNIYDGISYVNKYGFREVELNDRYSLADKKGELILDDFYDKILFVNKTKAIVISIDNNKSSIIWIKIK